MRLTSSACLSPPLNEEEPARDEQAGPHNAAEESVEEFHCLTLLPLSEHHRESDAAHHSDEEQDDVTDDLFHQLEPLGSAS